MKPLVTVLIITYNHEKFIAQAIDSALAQKTAFGVEILIGDDCSKDTTGQIVAEYARKYPDRISLVSSAENVGAIRNEKRLIENANGKYLAFLEGDDYWTDDLKLQKQVDFLEANPGYGMVHADVDHFYESSGNTEKQINRKNHVSMPEGSVFHELMKPEPVFIKTATVCFRKELVDKHFDYNRAIEESWPLTDFPLWLDIAAHSRVHYMDEVFATYRLLNESASRMESPEKKLNYHKGLHRIKQHYGAKYLCEPAVKEAIEQDYHRNLLKIAYNLGDAKLAGESVDYLKSRGHKLSRKEQLLVLGAKHESFKRVLNLLRK